MAKHLYVVFTNGPGPGARALVNEAIQRTAEDGKNDMAEAVLEAADGACEFVELEDDQGRSLGAAAAEWVEWGEFRALKIRRPQHGQLLPALLASLLEAGVAPEQIEEAVGRSIDKHRHLGSPIAGNPLARAFVFEQSAFLERGWE